MASSNEIRSSFLDFFRREGHEVVPSSPLVPRNDPTLMFTNAGMVPFKNVFTGLETRPYKTATSSQKCVRAGGKHNDLDNVGYTARHHTFFEMLGNFSFGDYFKERAIDCAWRLITKEWGISRDRLLVTVYHTDDEAFDLWKKIAGFSDDRIIRIPTKDNFWSMGDTGPCGPCSEIFYDHGEHIYGGPPGSPEEDGDRWTEIWNLVFMQYEQVDAETRLNLPHPSIDTGMGLERIAAVLQGKHDNYDTDTLRALILASADATGTDPDGAGKVSHRVIADHLRAVSFLIADGVLPSNDGRGYVLRRIMRRAMRHAHLLGAKEPLMHRLVPALTQQMGTAYPELIRADALIRETLKLEETRFRQTLDKGLRLLDEEVAHLAPGAALPGEVAFKLYDTYGFPLDLTEDALRSQGLAVDKGGFDEAMARQKAAARAAWSGSGEKAAETLWFDLAQEAGATEFVGYNAETAQGQVIAIVKDGARVDSATAGEQVRIVTNQTPFYGESGGQMGDAGRLRGANGLEIEISDTQKPLGLIHVHVGEVKGGTVRVGDELEMIVDGERRSALRANHSATHLLHEALRRRLGAHVTQKGSLVAPDRLRFDISHNKALSEDEIAAVEADVNARIRENHEVVTRLMTPDEAIAAGAMALFGEKYGDEVRVVSMGEEEGSERGHFSVELCGGTHVNRTGDIGVFAIVGEGAVSAGVRRVEALTGEAARRYFEEQEARVKAVASALKASPAEIVDRVSALIEERRKLERELAEAKRALALGGGSASAGAGGPAAEQVNGINFLGQVVDGLPARELRGLVDGAKSKLGSGVAVMVTTDGGKASVAVGVTDDLTGKISAVDLVKAAVAAVGGQGGGGRPDMAQGGGPNVDAAAEALAAVKAVIGAAAAA
ncbi:alanine--tRNA ligase [Pedomonas mirosovicensis]|uniref:alanine--tRNA ligase n=1 Tax=Pedomonas mirosovicensis TaxID=2908641 RepID=UPI002167AAA5|nr:alanine--tRNA ligase [Pedomonas mirosovicensis]MCH8685126.1 alanine--tRNA ligase [Pedomonas mirosovicensis]